MRVLHVVKTSDGAVWAAREAAELVKLGIEVHAAVPSLHGHAMSEWHRSGARIHAADLDFPAKAPWRMPAAFKGARQLVDKVAPDVIHSHFVGTTLLLRAALGKNHAIPRVFQVPGPLHLEHKAFRTVEIQSAGRNDFWVGTSKYIVKQYLDAGVAPGKIFLSYHGGSGSEIPAARSWALRQRLGIPDGMFVVGNANYLYPPKAYLGQKTGIKRHEDVIDALGLVIQARRDVVGVLIGGVFGKGHWYEEVLRARARARGGDRILMPGYMSGAQIAESWADFDCAVHAPLSENCGGVVEPLLAGVPTIAARVGGLPEVVMDGLTGKTVAGGSVDALANAIYEVLETRRYYRGLAANGRRLVKTMFDVRRTAAEVAGVYRHVLDPATPRPEEFDGAGFLHAAPAYAAAG